MNQEIGDFQDNIMHRESYVLSFVVFKFDLKMANKVYWDFFANFGI
jgi:hypothetical protein